VFKLTKLISANPDCVGSVVDGLNAAARNSASVVRSLLSPTLDGSINSGNLVWHLQFPDRTAFRAWEKDPGSGMRAAALLADKALVSQVESIAYQGGRAGRKRALDKGVYRMLWINVNRAADEAAIAQFEAETFEMGLYISGIANWQISRVDEASGTRSWTHVWEQEYENLDGLMKSYMMHPHHWGWVNRWYDPECVEHMIDNYVCHAFCDFTGGAIINPSDQS